MEVEYFCSNRGMKIVRVEKVLTDYFSQNPYGDLLAFRVCLVITSNVILLLFPNFFDSRVLFYTGLISYVILEVAQTRGVGSIR